MVAFALESIPQGESANESGIFVPKFHQPDTVSVVFYGRCGSDSVGRIAEQTDIESVSIVGSGRHQDFLTVNEGL